MKLLESCKKKSKKCLISTLPNSKQNLRNLRKQKKCNDEKLIELKELVKTMDKIITQLF